MQYSPYLILIPLFPLLGFLLNSSIVLQKLRGKGFFGTTLTTVSACTMPFLSFLVSIYCFYTLFTNHDITNISQPNLLDWMVLQNFSLNFGLTVDHLSAVMILIVTGVGFLIHVYSTGYMKGDEGYIKFFCYLNLFLFFMLILVMADSLALLFVGWEGVGLCSYLLIGFWFTDKAKAQAGKKAFIVNRVGDFGFMIGMFLIVSTFAAALSGTDGGTNNYLSFEFIRNNAALLAPAASLITLALFFGATGKSAQIPLYVWLPDAMAGPTPVSALIHAATMVTAGIYMIARLGFLFVMAPATMNTIALIGLLTAFFAALIGATQNDIKKVLAYSTVSQLGYMFLGLGVGAFSAAIFHVMTHAFFKACLFLGAGSVIHSLHHEQDMRNMGGLMKKMPKTAITFLICTLAISGIPPLAGFFSKDEILYLTYAYAPSKSFFWLGLLTAGLTAFYMMRAFTLTFLGKTRYAHPDQIHESPSNMTIPLIILAGLAIVGGWVGIPHYNVFEHWLEFLGQKTPHHIEGSPLQEFHLMGISVAWAALCAFVSYTLYKRNPEFDIQIRRRFANLYDFIQNKFRVDEAYQSIIITPIKVVSDWVLYRFFDRQVIDGAIVNGSGQLSQFVGRVASLFQSGVLSHYVFYFAVGLAVVVYVFVS